MLRYARVYSFFVGKVKIQSKLLILGLILIRRGYLPEDHFQSLLSVTKNLKKGGTHTLLCDRKQFPKSLKNHNQLGEGWYIMLFILKDTKGGASKGNIEPIFY